MRVGREFAATGVTNTKIYVIGGCVVDNWARARDWAEVFDPKTKSWSPVCSDIEFREKWMHASAVIGDKIYAMGDGGGVKYDPKNLSWESVECELDINWRGGGGCEVKGLFYWYGSLGKIMAFDVNKGVWRELRGVGKDLPRFLCGPTMANLGGNLVVVVGRKWRREWEWKGNGNLVCGDRSEGG